MCTKGKRWSGRNWAMDCSTPGFPALQHLSELPQTHVHQVGDAIQPSYPLSSLSPTTREVLYVIQVIGGLSWATYKCQLTWFKARVCKSPGVLARWREGKPRAGLLLGSTPPSARAAPSSYLYIPSGELFQISPCSLACLLSPPPRLSSFSRRGIVCIGPSLLLLSIQS